MFKFAIFYAGFYYVSGGEIPDATTIHQIRKQRQMARDMGDFLPLDDTVKFENTKSRLVRYLYIFQFVSNFV